MNAESVNWKASLKDRVVYHPRDEKSNLRGRTAIVVDRDLTAGMPMYLIEFLGDEVQEWALADEITSAN